MKKISSLPAVGGLRNTVLSAVKKMDFAKAKKLVDAEQAEITERQKRLDDIKLIIRVESEERIGAYNKFISELC